MGHGGHVSPLLPMAGHGGTVSRRTENKKLTKLYWPLRKSLPKRLIVLSEPKKVEGHDPQFFFRGFPPDRCPHLRTRPVPPPTFKLVPTPLSATRLSTVSRRCPCLEQTTCIVPTRVLQPHEDSAFQMFLPRFFVVPLQWLVIIGHLNRFCYFVTLMRCSCAKCKAEHCIMSEFSVTHEWLW